jgi:outer membrane protein
MRGRGLRGIIRLLALLAAAALVVDAVGTASADTLEWALVQAYQNNPSLNAQRAALRAADENVPQALSGFRPKLSVTASGGYNYTSVISHSVNQQVFPNSVSYNNVATNFGSRSIGATATQTVYNGFQTANRTRQAESQVMGARETLRVTEQQVLLDAATAYMNLLRDQAILDLNRRNVEVLTEQLKQTRDRFNVGEVTRTDVAQAESRLAAGRSALLQSQSNYVTSQANYRRVIGVDAGRLEPGTPVDRLSPSQLARAIVEGQTQSPSVLASMYGVDVAELAVKISEGSLYPNLGLTASATKSWDPLFNINKETAISILGTLTVPIYQGGSEYSAIRQSKETLGQQRLNVDVTRDQARATVVQNWGQLDAAKAQIEATTAQVNAAEIALNGVREEARVGQRTTLDVLNAQQELVNARFALVTAQHDRVVASYSLLAAVGGLSMQHLGLNVMIYDPQVHYQQVRDAWIGVRAPDGR